MDFHEFHEITDQLKTLFDILQKGMYLRNNFPISKVPNFLSKGSFPIISLTIHALIEIFWSIPTSS